MGALISFGEDVAGFDRKMLNEREARASAGIMFALGLMSLFSVPIAHSLFWAELFSITFIIEFAVRTLVNPKLAPYLVLSSFLVSDQGPEWVDAAPKRFAWLLGSGLGVVMTAFIVLDTMSPARLLICLLCLFLLFSESALGICWGCLLYKRLNKPVENCPGGVCEVHPPMRHKGRKALLLAGYALLFGATFQLLSTTKYAAVEAAPVVADSADCVPPDWAVAMGHGAMWKEHHCEPVAAPAAPSATPQAEECVPPDWAVAMGHGEMWKEHHCP